MAKFQDKVVWITGAGSGIGEAVALAMAKHGAWVFLSGRREEQLERVRQNIERKGGKAFCLPVDVTNKQTNIKECSRKH